MSVVLYNENGILGYGRIVEAEKKWEPDMINAGGQPITLNLNAAPASLIAPLLLS